MTCVMDSQFKTQVADPHTALGVSYHHGLAPSVFSTWNGFCPFNSYSNSPCEDANSSTKPSRTPFPFFPQVDTGSSPGMFLSSYNTSSLSSHFSSHIVVLAYFLDLCFPALAVHLLVEILKAQVLSPTPDLVKKSL